MKKFRIKQVLNLLLSLFLMMGTFLTAVAEEKLEILEDNNQGIVVNMVQTLSDDLEKITIDVVVEYNSDNVVINSITIKEIGESIATDIASFEIFENGVYILAVEYLEQEEIHSEEQTIEIEGLVKELLSNEGTQDELNITELTPLAIVNQGTIGTVDWTLDDTGLLTFGGGTFADSFDWYGWSGSFRGTTTHVVFTQPVIAGNSLSRMFEDWNQLLTIDGLDRLDTSNVKTMTQMFKRASKLTSLDVSNFNTSNVTSMRGMFENASKLVNLDVSNFDTFNVEGLGMIGMFRETQALENLDVSNFNTSKITDLSGMFKGARSLASLNVSKFNTSNVTNMSQMFEEMYSLTSINVSNFDTSNVANMSQMFTATRLLASLDVSNFNTSKVTDMSSMFLGMVSLTSVDIGNFDTSNVTRINNMFSGTVKLTSLDLSSFDTSKVVEMTAMFESSFNPDDKVKSQLTLGANFRFKNNTHGLKGPSSDKNHTGKWQHIGTGTVDNPNGVILTHVEFLAYDGTLPGTYVWEKTIPTNYELAYNANGGAGTMASTLHTEGDVVLLASNNFTPPTGTVFLGWSLTPEIIVGETDTRPVMATEATIGIADITVYAVWATDANGNGIADIDEVVPTITLTYHQNNGRPNVNITVTIGGMIGGFTPVKEGHTFEGWYFTPDFQGGTDFDHSYRPATSVDLYAKWSINIYRARFEDWNGQIVEETEYDFGARIVMPTSPNREGYSFVGWTPEVETTMPARDVVYVATYTMIPIVTPTPSTPAPSTPTPEAGRTCQDDGYSNGYYWNGTACVIDGVTLPVVNQNPPTDQNKPNQSIEEPKVEEEKIITPVIDTVIETPEATLPEVEENIEVILPTTTPLAGTGGWSVLNVLLTGLATILTIISFVLRKKKEETAVEEDKEIVYLYKRNSIYSVLMLVTTVGLGIFLITTHDFTLDQILINQWTPLFISAMCLAIILFFFSLRWKEVTE